VKNILNRARLKAYLKVLDATFDVSEKECNITVTSIPINTVIEICTHYLSKC